MSSTGARDGNDAVKGAELRVREANEAHGIDGRNIELRSLDMKQSAAEAVKSYTELAQEMGVCAVIGSSVLTAGVAVSPVADMVKVPLLSLCIDDRVTTPDLKLDAPDAVGTPRRYVFMVPPSGSQVASSLAEFAAERFALTRYATFADPTSPVSVIQARSFESAVKKAGKVVVLSAEIPQSEADYGQAMTRMKEADVEAVFICGTATQNAALARAARQIAFRPTLIGNQEWYFPLLDDAGYVVEGAYFGMATAPDDRALAQIADRFQAAFGEQPRPAVLPGYLAVDLVLAAVRKARTVDPGKIRDVLEQATGLTGNLSVFDMDRKTHRAVAPPIAVMRIMGGRFVTLEARFTPKSARGGSLLGNGSP